MSLVFFLKMVLQFIFWISFEFVEIDVDVREMYIKKRIIKENNQFDLFVNEFIKMLNRKKKNSGMINVNMKIWDFICNYVLLNNS